jgi:hypothetical protein
MSQSEQPSEIAYSWDDPNRCPFCMTALDDPGAGFVEHLDDSPVCESGFETWRTSVADDMRGEWSG